MMLVEPGETPVTRPVVAPTVATAGLVDFHLKAALTMPPATFLAVALRVCCRPTEASVTDFGDTVTRVTVFLEVTRTDADLVTEPTVTLAVTVVVPVSSTVPLPRVTVPITLALDDVQTIESLIASPRVFCAMALNPMESGRDTNRIFGAVRTTAAGSLVTSTEIESFRLPA